MMASTVTSLILPNTVTDIVAAYRQTCADVQTICDMGEAANRRIAVVAGESWRCRLGFGYGKVTIDRDAAADTLKNLRHDVWHLLLSMTDARSFMSDARYRGIVQQIDDGSAPDITEENISGWLMQIVTSMDALLLESMTEVFEWLRPRRSKYKHNSEFEIPVSVVLSGWVECYSSGAFDLNYREAQRIQALDNVFHLLDGRGVAKCPDDLGTRMRTVMRDSRDQELTTPYFRVKWFRNGNAHVWFLRPDLLAQFNARAGGNRLHQAAAPTVRE